MNEVDHYFGKYVIRDNNWSQIRNQSVPGPLFFSRPLTLQTNFWAVVVGLNYLNLGLYGRTSPHSWYKPELRFHTKYFWNYFYYLFYSIDTIFNCKSLKMTLEYLHLYLMYYVLLLNCSIPSYSLILSRIMFLKIAVFDPVNISTTPLRKFSKSFWLKIG